MSHEFSIQKIIYKKSLGRVMGGRCQVREELRTRIGGILVTSYTLFWCPVAFAMSVSFPTESLHLSCLWFLSRVNKS